MAQKQIFLFPAPTTWCSAGLEVLVTKGGMLPPRDTTLIPLNWKFRLLPTHFGLLMPLNEQARKRVTGLAGVIDPDYQEEVGLPLHRKSMSAIQGIP